MKRPTPPQIEIRAISSRSIAHLRRTTRIRGALNKLLMYRDSAIITITSIGSYGVSVPCIRWLGATFPKFSQCFESFAQILNARRPATLD